MTLEYSSIHETFLSDKAKARMRLPPEKISRVACSELSSMTVVYLSVVAIIVTGAIFSAKITPDTL
jgi:hypothetical protein